MAPFNCFGITMFLLWWYIS